MTALSGVIFMSLPLILTSFNVSAAAMLPSTETAAMLFWVLLTSGQITMRKVDGWQTLGEKLAAAAPVDLAA